MSERRLFSTALQSWIDIFTQRTMRSVLLYAKEIGLSMSQLGAMMHILKGTGGVSDIGGDLGISSAAASQMLERLVQQGLISRTEDPRDRRVKQIVLTDKGQQVMQASMQAGKKWLDELADKLTPSEQKQVAAALSILVARAIELAQQSSP
ncbi:MAG: MarR family winged helix-turn-helix transcriptional regulator [Anaerolineae bacterium]